MPGTHNTTSVATRRQDIAARYLRGQYQSAIAQDLGISQSQVSLDLKAIRTAWMQSALRDFDAAKAQELAKIDAAEQAYWAGWERSCTQREVTVTEATEDTEIRINAAGEVHTVPVRRNKARVQREGQAGDPRFLDGVLKCIHQRCDILGLSVTTEAAKELGQGLTAVLAQARTLTTPSPPRPPSPIAEA